MHFERWYPLAGGAVSVVAVRYSGLSLAEGTTVVDKVLPITVSAAAILAGFQATAQSVMLALLDSAAAKFLKRAEKFDLLVKYHWSAILALLLFVAVSIGVLISRSLAAPDSTVSWWTLGILVFLLGWASLASVRITRLMVKLLLLKDPG